MRSSGEASPSHQPGIVNWRMGRGSALCGPSRSAVAGRGEFEYGMAVCFGGKFCYWRVLAGLEVGPGGRGEADVSLEDRPCLGRGQFPDSVDLAVTPAAEGDLSGGAGVQYPRHGAVGGDQPLSVVLIDQDHRVGARPTGFAAACGQQVRGSDAEPGQGAEDRIADTVAAAAVKLPCWPGAAVRG